MNGQNQEDQSFFNMIAEHQDISECVLRLHSILNKHPCVQYMPTEACIIINQMNNLVRTGKKQPDDINDLPFIDPEIQTGLIQMLEPAPQNKY